MPTEQPNIPDSALAYFKPGEYGALRAFLEKGETETALFMLNDIITRPEPCIFTVTHRHEYGVTTYITVGTNPPDPYTVMGDSWEGNHKGEEMSLNGPLNLRDVARSEDFSVPGELCPRCRHAMNTDEYTHPAEAQARKECPECQLCVECCPNKPDEEADEDPR